jgi:uncharacterized protein (DUF1330 family)
MEVQIVRTQIGQYGARFVARCGNYTAAVKLDSDGRITVECLNRAKARKVWTRTVFPSADAALKKYKSVEMQTIINAVNATYTARCEDAERDMGEW